MGRSTALMIAKFKFEAIEYNFAMANEENLGMVRLLTGATEGVDIPLVNITPMPIIVNI